MGVPKWYNLFVRSIEGIEDPHVKKCFGFCGDLNGLMHKVAQHVFGYGNDLYGNPIPEDKMLVIVNKLKTQQSFELLVAEYLNLIPHVLTTVIIDGYQPTDVLIIAVDGIACLAKVIQQRIRRFKSGYERFLKGTQGIVTFDTSYLTAGTEFMDRVSDAIQNWILENKSRLPKYSYFSPSTVRGEGEHKIFKMLDIVREYEVSVNQTPTTKDKDRVFRDQKFVVYGLDADLGILSVLRDYNFVWCREGYNINQTAVGVNINVMRDYIVSLMSPISTDEELTIQQKLNMMIDFLLICIKIGDDFLPAMFTLNQNSGITLRKICSAYKEFCDGELKFICNPEGNINLYLYKEFLEFIQPIEKELYDRKVEIDSLERQLVLEPDNSDIMAEVLNYRKENNIKANSYETYTPCRFFPMEYEQFNEFWKTVMVRPALIAEQIYNTPKISYLTSVDSYATQTNCFQTCQSYLTGVQWNIKYYLGYEVNNWFYPTQIAPTITNLVEFMNSGRFVVEEVLRSPSDPYINATQVLATVLNPHFSPDVIKSVFKSESNRLKLLTNCPNWKTYFPSTLSFVFQGGYKSDEHLRFPLVPQISIDDFMKIIKSKNDKTPNHFNPKELGTLTYGNGKISIFDSILTSTVSFNLGPSVPSEGTVYVNSNIKLNNLAKQISIQENQKHNNNNSNLTEKKEKIDNNLSRSESRSGRGNSGRGSGRGEGRGNSGRGNSGRIGNSGRGNSGRGGRIDRTDRNTVGNDLSNLKVGPFRSLASFQESELRF